MLQNRHRISLAVQVVCVLVVCGLAKGTGVQKRKPSSSEELAHVVRLARSLEVDPLGGEASKSRKSLGEWMRKAADIRVPRCSSLAIKNESKSKYDDELTFQLRASMAAFMIEHRDRAESPEERLIAGIEGLLKAYEVILRSNQKAQSQFLDLLNRLQRSKQIQQAVRDVMARCSEVSLSDKNVDYNAPDTVYAEIEVGRPPVIKNVSNPAYTREALINQTGGKVVLLVVLGSLGRVTDVRVVEGLPNGLTESAVTTAMRIQFEPAITNGRRVSTLVKVQYNFRTS